MFIVTEQASFYFAIPENFLSTIRKCICQNSPNVGQTEVTQSRKLAVPKQTAHNGDEPSSYAMLSLDNWQIKVVERLSLAGSKYHHYVVSSQ